MNQPGIQTGWRDLPAGRELDRIIAERLGWTEFKRESRIEDFHPPEYELTWIGKNPFGKYEAVPWYSTDLNDAITLAEDSNNFKLRHFTQTTPPDAPKWWATFSPEKVTEWGISNAPALAVCRAWLAWREQSANQTHTTP